MNDDIETLRKFVTKRYPGYTPSAAEALLALDRLQARVAELEKERGNSPHFNLGALSAAIERARAAEADRDAARAKLERAKEALEPFAEAEKTMVRSLGKTADDHLYGVYAGDLRRARVVHSELANDAPAQQTQRDIRELSGHELAARIVDLERRWDNLIASLKESGGCSGSPCEWLAEEIEMARAEQKRRGAP